MKGIVDVQSDISRLGREHPLAVFVDLDGTIIDLAAAPELVVVPPDLPAVLRRAHAALDGALAIVTGRPLAEVDRLLRPLVLAGAGLHGGEVRQSGGPIQRTVPQETVAVLRRPIVEAMARLTGVRVEDKGDAIAVHFRQAPERAGEVHRLLLDIVAMRIDRFRILSGKRVFEVLPRAFRKDLAVAALMARPPFAGRVPVYVGDDRTDDDAIAEATRLGGLGLRVGGGVDDGSEFADPQAVRDWLGRLPALLQREVLAAK